MYIAFPFKAPLQWLPLSALPFQQTNLSPTVTLLPFNLSCLFPAPPPFPSQWPLNWLEEFCPDQLPP